MKPAKKITCLMLALVLALGMGVTVMASASDAGSEGTETCKITAPEMETSGQEHTYEVYQIFTGKYSSNGVLSNIEAGRNVNLNGETIEEILGKLDQLDQDASDVTKLSVIGKYVNLTEPFAIIKSGESVEVPKGYYLIKDKDTTLDNTNDAYTLYIVEVVGEELTIKPKSGKPTVDKEVQEKENDWGETADHAINESFQFKLTATLPKEDALSDYETYKLVFHDTMSDGVTFDSIASVTAAGKNVAKQNYNCSAEQGQAGGEWTLTINDLKEIAGSDWGTKEITVVVIYNVHLNEKAVVHNESGSVNKDTGNNNKASLEYSNNPNWHGTGEPPTGRTKEDYVWVFTYEVKNEKVDGKNKPLPDAGFRLYRTYDKDNKVCSDEIGLIFDVEKNAYRPVKTGETAVEMKSAQDGVFNIIGLDGGTYYLKETTTPEGYNTCDVTEIKIGTAHEENKDGISAKLTLAADSMHNTIVNNKGVVLPSTGGIGTTVFYVVGGILVLGCGVILVARKRANKTK